MRIIIENKNNALKLESGYSIVFFLLLEQFEKGIQFCLTKQMKIAPQWKTRMKSLLVSKAAQKCHDWHDAENYTKIGYLFLIIVEEAETSQQ